MKININLSVLALITLCFIAYLAIAALAAGAFFLMRDLVLPYFGSNMVLKLSCLAAVISFLAILFITLKVANSRIFIIAILSFATLAGLALFVLSCLAAFDIYSGWAEVIFGWESFAVSIVFLLSVLVMFLTISPKLMSDRPYKEPRMVRIGLNRFSSRLQAAIRLIPEFIVGALSALAIIVGGDTVKVFVTGQELLIDYYTGLVIYLVVGLMILRQAGRKVIDWLAKLTVGLAGFSLLFFLLPIILDVNHVSGGHQGDGLLTLRLITELHSAFLITAITLVVFLEILIYNVMRNPIIKARPWVEKKEFDPYWTVYLLVQLLNVASSVGYAIEKARRYRAFWKVAAVSLACFLLGRLVILEFNLQTKEYQVVVWFLAGLASYLYLGRRLIKSKRKVAILALLASALTAATILTAFYILSFFNLYDEASRLMLSWPAIISAVLILTLTFFGYHFYYRNLPQKSYRQQLQDWFQKGKEFNDEHIVIAIVLMTEIACFLSGAVILVFRACLDEKFAIIGGKLQTIGATALFFSFIALFISLLAFIAVIWHEKTLAEMTPEEREKYEKERLELERDIMANNMFSNPFNPPGI